LFIVYLGNIKSDVRVPTVSNKEKFMKKVFFGILNARTLGVTFTRIQKSLFVLFIKLVHTVWVSKQPRILR